MTGDVRANRKLCVLAVDPYIGLDFHMTSLSKVMKFGKVVVFGPDESSWDVMNILFGIEQGSMELFKVWVRPPLLDIEVQVFYVIGEIRDNRILSMDVSGLFCYDEMVHRVIDWFNRAGGAKTGHMPYGDTV